MSCISKIAFGTLVAIAFASPAAAQDSYPWDMKERMAYAVTPGGKMMTMNISDKGMSMMMKRAKRVPRGTVFFMSNGQLYMMTSGAFDRAGSFMGGGN